MWREFDGLDRQALWSNCYSYQSITLLLVRRRKPFSLDRLLAGVKKTTGAHDRRWYAATWQHLRARAGRFHYWPCNQPASRATATGLLGKSTEPVKKQETSGQWLAIRISVSKRFLFFFFRVSQNWNLLEWDLRVLEEFQGF